MSLSLSLPSRTAEIYWWKLASTSVPLFPCSLADHICRQISKAKSAFSNRSVTSLRVDKINIILQNLFIAYFCLVFLYYRRFVKFRYYFRTPKYINWFTTNFVTFWRTLKEYLNLIDYFLVVSTSTVVAKYKIK